jgi:hypothetical protein
MHSSFFLHDSNYNGGAGCRLCKSSYGASSFLTAMVQSAALAEWERELGTALKAGPYSSFSSADKCKIQMKNKSNDDAVEETAAAAMIVSVDSKKSIDTEYHQVEINVNCGAVQWNKLSLEEEDFIAKALMQAYKSVHKRLDGGDWHLDNVVWEKNGNMLRGGGR